MILGPLLLELGTHPVSAAATSGLLVLGSSGSAVLEVWPHPTQQSVMNLRSALDKNKNK